MMHMIACTYTRDGAMGLIKPAAAQIFVSSLTSWEGAAEAVVS